MNEKIKQITTGAMFTAIFCILMLVNRQTGEAFAEFIYFLLPIPMVGYASKYGFKSGLTAMAAMTLLSSFLSTPTGIFYALSESFIGLVLGSGIHKQKQTGKLLLVTMGLAILVNILNLIFLALVYGVRLSDQVVQIQQLWSEALNSVPDSEQKTAFEMILTSDMLTKMLILSTIFSGLIQGFVVFQLSLFILRRIKFNVPKPQPIFMFYPPQWSGMVALVLYLSFSYSTVSPLPGIWNDIIQIAGMASQFYLMFFGCIAAALLCRKHLTTKAGVAILVITLAFFMMPIVLLILGFVYTMPMYHDSMMPPTASADSTDLSEV